MKSALAVFSVSFSAALTEDLQEVDEDVDEIEIKCQCAADGSFGRRTGSCDIFDPLRVVSGKACKDQNDRNRQDQIEQTASEDEQVQNEGDQSPDECEHQETSEYAEIFLDDKTDDRHAAEHESRRQESLKDRSCRVNQNDGRERDPVYDGISREDGKHQRGAELVRKSRQDDDKDQFQEQETEHNDRV